MSYGSNIAYQQQPLRRPGRDDYYYGGSNQYENRELEASGRGNNFTPDRNQTGRQSGHFENSSQDRYYRDTYDTQSHDHYNTGHDASQSGFGDYHSPNSGPPPTHRYPHTFQSDQNRSPNDQSLGGSQDRNMSQYSDQRYSNQPPKQSENDRYGQGYRPSHPDSGRYRNQPPSSNQHPNYQYDQSQSAHGQNERERYDPPDHHPQQSYPYSNQNSNSAYDRNEDSYHSNHEPYRSYGGDYHQGGPSQDSDNRNFQRDEPQDANSRNYQLDRSRRNQDGANYQPNRPQLDANASGWNQRQPPTRHDNNRRSFERNQPGDLPYDQNRQNSHFHDNYRNDSYNQDAQNPSEPPQIIAKTSGSNAVFGIVSRGDGSSMRINDQPPVRSPTRTNPPPVLSPPREYGPSYGQFKDNGQGRQQPRSQHHQYRQALTPISEKPSPTSSVGSRGQMHDTKWPKNDQPDFQNQYGHPDASRKPWQGNRGPGPENDRQMYDNVPRSYQERPYGRHGNRDIDASSGYASESTHNTENSYNDPQRYHDKNTYSPDFPPPPPELQQNEKWSQSPGGGYSRSPPMHHPEMDRNQYDSGQNLRSRPQVTQQYDRSDYRDNEPSHDSYGPPVQTQYPNRQQPNHDSRYGPHDFSNAPHRPQTFSNQPPTHNDPHRQSQGPSPHRNMVNESGVEESHVPSVQAAKSMFEKRSDPRKPPPLPKPLVAPKPVSVNPRPIPPRPIPPRPTNLSGWNSQEDRNQIRSPSYYGPTSPSSSQNTRSQSYFPQQPTHSRSMDNLDDRSRFQSPPSHHPHHAQSMQNLDERSRPLPDRSYPLEEKHLSSNVPPRPNAEYTNNNFQNSNNSRYQQPQSSDDRSSGQYTGYSNRNYSEQRKNEDRPIVLAVKYNQESGPSVIVTQDPPRPRTSWSTSHPDPEQAPQHNQYRGHPPPSPTRNDDRSWPNDTTMYSSRQSFKRDDNRQVPPPQAQQQSDFKDEENYVPDVVARSYELASRAQEQTQQHDHSCQQNRSYNADSRGGHNYNTPPQNRQSSDRWPTPPPPITQDQNHTPQRSNMVDNNERSNWQRVGPTSTQYSRPAQPYSGMSQPNSTDHHHGYNPIPASHLPRPPQQQLYQEEEDESSEIDVDAPTPPPTKNQRPLTVFGPPRVDSPYNRNKPVPVTVENPSDWRIVSEQPPNSRESIYSLNRPQSSRTQQAEDDESPIKSPPPQKPQRNSTSLSPQFANTSLSIDQGFDFDVRPTAPLQNFSSREKLRLSKSGAMANRKPPSRQGSTDNLTKIGDEDDFQIEVTDSDLSSKGGKMEVHRLESMRLLQAEKAKKTKASGDLTSNDKGNKLRSSQKALPPSISEESDAPAKKPESKLVFKKPSGDAAKTIPMPSITEPVNQSTRRPPTYTGFGYVPEKPKTDLLAQFKSARDSALRSASEKQERALKSVSALVKFNQGKKEPKKQPQPKLTAAERNAKVLDKMNVEVTASPEEESRDRNPYSRSRNERGNIGRSSTRSSSNVKPEKYDGDDDTNGSRAEKDRKGRGRDRQRDDTRGKSRGRSTSRGRELSPDHRRGRSSSRGRDISPGNRRGRSTSRERELSPRRRHRSKSRDRSLSPDYRHPPRRGYDDRRYEERRRRDDDSSYRRSNSPPSRFRDDNRHYPRVPPPHHPHHHQPYNRSAREPDWVEQFRRGREGRSSGPARRAWVNDPRRVEVTTDGRRRELDMDAFEREVKRATAYNSDFEQVRSGAKVLNWITQQQLSCS